MNSEPIDITPDDTPYALIEKAQQLNMARHIRLGQQGMDISFPFLVNRINFIMTALVGPVETNEDRQQIELVWETQVLPSLLDAMESQLAQARLANIGQMGPEAKKLFDPREN